MKRIILIFLLFISINSFSQNLSQSFDKDKLIEDFEKNQRINNNNDYSVIEGSPYWNEDFATSILFLCNKQRITKFKIRYNIFNDAFEFKQGENILNLKKDKRIEKIKLNDHFFTLIEIDKYQKNTIVQILYDNKLKLYKKYNIHYLKAEEKRAYTQPKPNRFENSHPKLYLKIPLQESLIQIKRLKDFTKMFPDSSSKIKKFIKKNKIKIDNKEQLIQLVRFIEQIA